MQGALHALQLGVTAAPAADADAGAAPAAAAAAAAAAGSSLYSDESLKGFAANDINAAAAMLLQLIEKRVMFLVEALPVQLLLDQVQTVR